MCVKQFDESRTQFRQNNNSPAKLPISTHVHKLTVSHTCVHTIHTHTHPVHIVNNISIFNISDYIKKQGRIMIHFIAYFNHVEYNLRNILLGTYEIQQTNDYIISAYP